MLDRLYEDMLTAAMTARLPEQSPIVAALREKCSHLVSIGCHTGGEHNDLASQACCMVCGHTETYNQTLPNGPENRLNKLGVRAGTAFVPVEVYRLLRERCLVRP